MKKKRLIVVVDMQNDFVSRKGKMYIKDSYKTFYTIENLLLSARKNNDEVIFTLDTHTKEEYKHNLYEHLHFPLHCERDSWGWQIHDSFKPYLKTIPRVKMVKKSSFAFDSWHKVIGHGAEYSSIEIVGVATEVCVVANAIAIASLCPHTPVNIHTAGCAGISSIQENRAFVVLKELGINLV